MILELLEQDGFSMKKIANTDGGEFAGSCPFCGGRDRFRVWPGKGKFWCRGCDAKGDAIQYLRDHRKMSFKEACSLTGKTAAATTRPATPKAWTPEPPQVPPEAWQKKAMEFLDWAVDNLWSEHGAAMLQWLRDEKGLHDQTIRGSRLGFNPKHISQSGSSWGLSGDVTVHLSAGLIIPFSQDGEIHRLKIRLNKPFNGNRYVIVTGSGNSTMVCAGNPSAVVVVESELDAILLNQEAGDLCSVIALGSAANKPDSRTDTLLRAARTILASLDEDAAGGKAAWAFWSKQYGRKVKRWHCFKGKDPSESWKNGMDLRQWVTVGLNTVVPNLGRRTEESESAKSGLVNLPKAINETHTAEILADSSLPCDTRDKTAEIADLQTPPADTLVGTGLHKSINGDQVYDFADGTAQELFMAKGNFTREYQGRTVQINQMDYLTIPDDEIKTLLQNGLIKTDRDITLRC